MTKKLRKIFSIFKKIKKRFSSLDSERGAIITSIIVGAIVLGALGAGLGWLVEKGLAEVKLVEFLLAIAVTALKIPLAIGSLFLSFSVWLLNVVVQPNLFGFSYTRLDNPAVAMGWTLTRDLANMGIVLTLVVIGLATILRIETYQAKKTLPVLLIIALLINFTPVILGIVVDASNILMRSLLVNVDVGTIKIGTTFADEYSDLKDVWGEIIGGEEREEISEIDFTPLGRTAVLVAFGFIAGFVFLVFAFLFLFRYVAIWLLVVLSPLAFVSYVLPYTRRFFTVWWNHFLTWCFIGVFAALFIYIGSGILCLAGVCDDQIAGHKTLFTESFEQDLDEIEVQNVNPAQAPKIKGSFKNILSYGVGIAFLAMGLFATLSISAMGSGAVINIARRTGKGAAGWAALRVGRGIKPMIERPAKAAARGLTKTAEWLQSVRPLLGRGPRLLRPLGWVVPETVKRYGEFRPAATAAQEKAKAYSSRTLGDRVIQEVDKGSDATGDILEFVSRGDSQDLFEAAKRRRWGKGKSDEEILNHPKFRKILEIPMKIAFMSGLHNNIIRRDPRLASIYTGKRWMPGYKELKDVSEKELPPEQRGTGREEAIRKATKEARRSHITDTERDVFENETAVASYMSKGREIPEAIDANVKMGRETMMSTVENMFSKFVMEKSSFKDLDPDKIKEKLKDLTPEEKKAEVEAGVRVELETTLKAEGLKPAEIERRIKRETKNRLEKELKDLRSDDNKKAVMEYRKYIRETEGGDGYFVAVEGERLKERGWRTPQFLTPEEIKKKKPPKEKRETPLERVKRKFRRAPKVEKEEEKRKRREETWKAWEEGEKEKRERREKREREWKA